ncbi:PQQ-binding-like beta-propeller repeat protein [Alteromonadaceae bacterium BrNp21-10]|nr:PQQ-binding-like beta-propeller repeat protein [Alteromonadaceae bacterium BrNp21-10]
MIIKIRSTALVIVLVSTLSACSQQSSDTSKSLSAEKTLPASSETQWSSYLGDPGRNQYSPLTQITPDNVHQLEMAWSYETSDAGQMQMNPLIVDGVLYGIGSDLRAFALDAQTGKELWNFGDPYKQWHSTSRGVSYWQKDDDKRILFTVGANLYALNALTGLPVPSFGNKGAVDLHTGLPASAQDKFIVSNTPGAIYNDLIIMPVRVSEEAHSAPGDVRAFNVITGKLAWTFHTIPHPGEEGYDTWQNPDAYKNINVGGANNWAGMSVDNELGMVFVPTGSAAPDFYGANRHGANLYANSLLALDANTGKRIWHYQFVHHDLLDRDLPAPPNLLTVEHNGKKIAAVAQITKQGYVFVFDRLTGKPLFDIIEEPAPASTLAGEQAWPTQPKPVKPKSFARQSSDLTAKDINPYSQEQAKLTELFNRADKRWFAPPSTGEVLLLPGYDGGAEWGGAAADPDNGILYVNANEMPWILHMKEAEFQQGTLGQGLFNQTCAVCHQQDLSGNPQSGYPSLVDITLKLTPAAIKQLISAGRGRMPGFPHLSNDQQNAIVAFLGGQENTQDASEQDVATYQDRYQHGGYHKFVDSEGLPGISPPWGTLHAIDLNSGDFLWSIPFGETLSLKAKGIKHTGTENYGGPVVTQSGLLFIGATKDGYFRAYNKHTGALLWETKLPAAAFATPAIYEIDGKQYIVIACGGEKLGTEKGRQIVAFALPESN